MKTGIHPNYEKTTINCACGATYEVGSTKKGVRVDICAKCHPFFTGVQKIIDHGRPGREVPAEVRVHRGVRREDTPKEAR